MNKPQPQNTIEARDIVLAVVFVILGFVFTTKFFVTYLNSLNPALGMLLVFGLVTGCIFALSKLDLIMVGFKWEGFTKMIGWALITFAFYIIISNSSCYQNMTVYGTCDKVSNIFFQTPDGAMFWLWSRLIPITTTTGLQIVRLLTYCLTPGLLAFLGGMCVRGKQHLDGV